MQEVMQFWTIFDIVVSVNDVENRWQYWELKTILTTDDDFDNFGIVGNVRYCWQCCYFIVTLLIEGSLTGGILIQLTKRHISSQKILKAKISDRLLWQFFSDSFARGFDLNLSEDAELSLTLNPKYLTIVSLMTLFTFSLQNLSVALAMSQLNKILFSTFSVFLKVQNLQKFSLMLRKCSSSNIIIIFKYHQNWRGFWLSWGDPGESVLLRSRLPETPVHSSLYHHHHHHQLFINSSRSSFAAQVSAWA